jgi:hypothetical protein
MLVTVTSPPIVYRFHGIRHEVLNLSQPGRAAAAVSAIARPKYLDTVLEQRIKRNPTLTWSFDVSPTTGTRLPTSPLGKLRERSGSSGRNVFALAMALRPPRKTSLRLVGLLRDSTAWISMAGFVPLFMLANGGVEQQDRRVKGEDRFPRLWESGTVGDGGVADLLVPLDDGNL